MLPDDPEQRQHGAHDLHEIGAIRQGRQQAPDRESLPKTIDEETVFEPEHLYPCGMRWLLLLLLLNLPACGLHEQVTHATVPGAHTRTLDQPDPRLERTLADVSLTGRTVEVVLTRQLRCSLHHRKQSIDVTTTTRKHTAARTTAVGGAMLLSASLLLGAVVSANRCEQSREDMCGTQEMAVGLYALGGLLASTTVALIDQGRVGRQSTAVVREASAVERVDCGRLAGAGQVVELLLPDGSRWQGATDADGRMALSIGSQGLASLRRHQGRLELHVNGRLVRKVDLSHELEE